MKRFLTSALVAGLLVAPQVYADDATVNVGGSLHHDFTVGLDSDDALPDAVDTATEIRRARINVSGDIGEVAAYKAEYDFAGDGNAKYKDVTITLKDVGALGNVTAGHFKESFGLEELISENDTTFVERSLLSAFTPSRNHGFSIGQTLADGQLNLTEGVFRNTDDFAVESGDDNAWNYTFRATSPVMNDEDGVLHAGLAYTFNNVSDSVSYSSRAVNQGPTLVDGTGDIPADQAGKVGLELAWVSGPLSVQGEFMNASVDSEDSSDPTFSGYYTQVSYFLTGESRPYDAAKGNFGRVVPESDDGAVELAARFSSIDLDDEGVTGGEEDDVTLGVNWYIHTHLRAMLNYVHADLDNVGSNDTLVARVQADF